MSVLVRARNSSRQICGPIPTVDPDVSLPGFAFAYCTSSCSVFAGTDGLTTSALESLPDQGHRGEVFERLEIQISIERLRDGVGVGAAQQQRVAIGACLRHGLRAGSSPGTRQIFDDDALPQLRRQRLRDEARRDVGWPSRRERHDDLDQPFGVGLCVGRMTAGHGQAHGHDCIKHKCLRTHHSLSEMDPIRRGQHMGREFQRKLPQRKLPSVRRPLAPVAAGGCQLFGA